MRIEEPGRDDLTELAAVAAATFPLACPPNADPADAAAFIAENLSAEKFADYLTDPARIILIARDVDRILGYAMLIHGVPDDADVQQAVPLRPALEISKMYALPDVHGTGVSAALMTEALARGSQSGAVCVWLGVNQSNERAQRFYTKFGFRVGGTKTFRLGSAVENDYVMVRAG